MPGKLVTFGEVMMRLSPPLNYRFVQARELDITYGGGEANVSVSLARLGLPAEHVTVFPDHELGQAAAQHLRQQGVSLAHTVFRGHRLGLYFLESGASVRASHIVYDRADSAFANLQADWFDWETILTGVGWLHWTGITPAISAQAAAATAAAIQAARRLGITVSADVNYRRNLWQYGQRAQDVMPPLVAGCDIVVCAENDAEDLFGIATGPHSNDSFAQMAAQLLDRFPGIKQVITTRRDTLSASHNQLRGLLYDQTGITTETPTYDIVPIVDRIGGGDAFMAGFIYGTHTYATAEEALRCGVAASVLKHSIHGDANLATRSEIEAVMAGDTAGRLLR
ncbi:sugar kinase [Fibrella sp. HMF5036]|uniref:Sugar kinase n=1 Tax=Fibrella aquatilis TaxID=2817059 RepID=A0A939JZS5_9BACT|nr:sugar kinase [Fibrella aquatilis]